MAIDVSENTLVYPDVSPDITDADRKFIGWSIPEGSYLSGLDSPTNIVCGEHEEPIVCGEHDGPIVCVDGSGSSHYQGTVKARISNVTVSSFKVTFRYLDESGQYREAIEHAEQNQRLVPFHIHETAESGRVFRYWRLVSGNITSSLTIMSDCVFEGVYDVMEDHVEVPVPVDAPIVIVPFD